MKEIGNIIIHVIKDPENHYLFDVHEDNDDLVCIKDVIEDTLKLY